MRGFLIGVALAAGAFSAAAAQDVPAKRNGSHPPAYPAACQSTAASDEVRHTVTVAYSVTKKGLPAGVRVRESTNDCFNDTALAAVRSWTFEPRTVDGKKADQEDIETTFVFKLDEETQTEDFVAQPLLRVPPVYPSKCMMRAGSEEAVLVEFDVSTEGDTENIVIVDSSYDCLNGPAIKSVKQWKYEPRLDSDGKPVVIRGLQTLITFQLSGGAEGGAGEERIRPLVRRNFVRVQDKVKDGDYTGALEKLAEIEQRFGDTFTPGETGTFHQLRGVARLGLKDYAAALDDLRMAQTVYLPSETRQAIGETIVQLEKVVAAQQAQAASVQAAGAGEAEADGAKTETGQTETDQTESD